MNNLSCPWVNWAPPSLVFCEESLCNWIRTPANSWSSLAFCLVGLRIFYLERNNPRKELKGYGLMSISIGILSFFYHASLTRLGEIGDLASMFLIGVFLSKENMIRINWISQNQGRALFWIGNIVCTASLFKFKDLGAPLFFVQCMFALGLEIFLFKTSRGAGTYKYFKRSLFCWLSAQTIWFLDITKVVCSPSNHLLQGHAVWHVLMAGLAWNIYLHYTKIEYSYFVDPKHSGLTPA